MIYTAQNNSNIRHKAHKSSSGEVKNCQFKVELKTWLQKQKENRSFYFGGHLISQSPLCFMTQTVLHQIKLITIPVKVERKLQQPASPILTSSCKWSFISSACVCERESTWVHRDEETRANGLYSFLIMILLLLNYASMSNFWECGLTAVY